MNLRRGPVPPLLLAAASVAASAAPASAAPASAAPASAPALTAVAAHRMAAPPVVDGRIEEAEWAGVPTFSGLVDADTGAAAPPGEDGTFYLAYDDEAVYFAARIVTTEPGRIFADEFRDNVGLGGNDTVSLSLDPFGRLDDFSTFTINPRGANNLSIAGGRAGKAEWQGRISTRGRITETGWEVEARIPWRIIDLPAPGRRDLRFNVARYLQRAGRTYVWRYTQGANFDAYGTWKDVEVPSVERGRSLDLLPFVYGGVGPDGRPILNSGVDFRTSLNRDLSAVGTLNPDFRNIESQILGLEFSYFERLAGDARPFFQEGAEFFQTGFWQRLFASQRVPTLDVGAKVFGKADDRTNVGAMLLSDFGERQAVVGRISRQFDLESGGSLVFVGQDRRGERSRSARADVSRRFGDWSLYAFGAVTDDEVQGTGGAGEVGASYGADGRYFYFNAAETGPSFFPRLGFWPERDYRSLSLGGGQSWYYDGPGLGEVEVEFDASKAWRTNGDRYRQNLGAQASLTWANGLDLDFAASTSEFEANRDHNLGVSLELPRRNPYRRWSVDLNAGRRGGAHYRRTGINVAYRPFLNLQTAVSWQQIEHFESRQQAIVTASWEIGRYESIGGRLVATEGDVGGYLSYRRAGTTGAEYFVIVGDPTTTRWRNQLVLKAVFPLSIRL